MPALAAYIASCLAGLEVAPEPFARVKESLLRNVSGRSWAAAGRQPGGGWGCKLGGSWLRRGS